ncbi:MAG: DUF255 domain-containing protein [Saprospiraceae bacterium]|nr:DUF255 domain-containing protein [Saprospiraceae bacterium]
MKKVLPVLALVLISGLLYAFVLAPKPSDKIPASAREFDGNLTWMSWDEMVTAMESEPKKVLIDVYTDWCGWCKRMDQSTFVDPAVMQYLNENFYAVKFDAEQKEDVEFRGHTMKFVANGRRGSHELAVSLLNGRMSYPSIVYLNESLDRITVSPGYKDAPSLMTELEYIKGEHYVSTTFESFKANRGK